MATPLLIAGSEPSAITIYRYHVRDRVLARLHASRIDRALAAGVSPDSSAATSVRAHELIGMRTRQTLSGDLRDLMAQAKSPALRMNAIPICRRKVIAAQELIEATASRLVEDRPVSARGVAQIHLLLTDGLSPVYGDPNGPDLVPLVRAAMAALESEMTLER